MLISNGEATRTATATATPSGRARSHDAMASRGILVWKAVRAPTGKKMPLVTNGLWNESSALGTADMLQRKQTPSCPPDRIRVLRWAHTGKKNPTESATAP